MIFQEKRDNLLSDIPVPTVFFSQILPVIGPIHSSVYLYAHYIAQMREQDIDNKALADALKLTLDQVLESLDFLESCGLLVKHRGEDDLAWDFSIELLDLKALYYGKGKETAKPITEEELLHMSKSSTSRQMFARIEEIIQNVLPYQDSRKINLFIKEYSVDSQLVVEAFSFSASVKKNKTTASALGILRTWYLDGIRTAEELKVHLENRHHRYTDYRKILRFLGEYRLPTKAEEKLMDSWLDELNFDMEVIEAAFLRSVAIKNPNMKYVNGILKNWHKKYLDSPDTHVPAKANTISQLEYRTQILQKLDSQQNSVTPEEDKALTELYHSFSMKEILVAADYLQSKLAENTQGKHNNNTYLAPYLQENRITINALSRFLFGRSQENQTPKDISSSITWAELEGIIDEKPKPGKSSTKAGNKDMVISDLEAKLVEKRERRRE